ncbi:5,6-dimethylbenzimidazole synthase [Rhodococcus sp. IEGM 1408]|uniref:5,6-dimethylbenzimidazole synthase n=1 Tax=Rhodococcus sp. IEGM 1408 TaxID=3082220 RepID=UPI002953F825|nr:5,6-dimethylbenzimidazole synthase [Rhodococcus sp. IEGM 1408]MDV8002978.1 5,6-dimethylbenzimidazole synthase [Rhodococcus sp. IEGM 1408]
MTLDSLGDDSNDEGSRGDSEAPDRGDLDREDFDRDALWRILATRRDHRHYHPTPVPRETIERLLEVFAVAPSVGLSQPWHVTVVQDRDIREAVHEGFRSVRAAESQRFDGERRELYNSLRLEGILQAPGGLVISHVPPGGPVLGTTSVPAATEYSVIAAITLLWLAVTAEGLGMGWVSLVDPTHLSESVPLPEDARPLAYLCLGHPALDLKEPLLQTVGWERRSPLPVDWI